jgi:hypothetical protein
VRVGGAFLNEACLSAPTLLVPYNHPLGFLQYNTHCYIAWEKTCCEPKTKPTLKTNLLKSQA